MFVLEGVWLVMQIVKEKLEIDENLEKKINNLLNFNNIKAKLENGKYY